MCEYLLYLLSSRTRFPPTHTFNMRKISPLSYNCILRWWVAAVTPAPAPTQDWGQSCSFCLPPPSPHIYTSPFVPPHSLCCSPSGERAGGEVKQLAPCYLPTPPHSFGPPSSSPSVPSLPPLPLLYASRLCACCSWSTEHSACLQPVHLLQGLSWGCVQCRKARKGTEPGGAEQG